MTHDKRKHENGPGASSRIQIRVDSKPRTMGAANATPLAVATVSGPGVYDAARSGRIPSIRVGGDDGPFRFVP